MKAITAQTIATAIHEELKQLSNSDTDPEFEPLGEIVALFSLAEVGAIDHSYGSYLTMNDGSTFIVVVEQIKQAEVPHEG